MQVVLVVGGRVHVDDEVEVVDVDAARRDVGRDERGDLARLEPVEGAVALRLGAAAVQAGGAYAVRQQLLDHAVDPALGVDEHDHPAVASGYTRRHGLLVGLVHDVQDVVLHGGDRTGRRVDGVADRVGQEHLDELVDVLVQRRREQHPLAAGLDLLEQRRDLRHEAHVGHLVGLVEDGDRDLREVGVTAVDEVLQAAGGGDEHLGAAAQGAGLPVDRHAADDGRDAQVDGRGVGGQGVGDLLRELTGRYEDQRERRLRLRAAAGGTGEQRQAEGQRLAGAGAAAAEQVTAGEGVRQRRGLDGERLGDALGGEGLQQRLGHVHVRERGDRRQRRGDRLGHGEFLGSGHGGGLLPSRARLRTPLGRTSTPGGAAAGSCGAGAGHARKPS
ncbi:hypothetical protein GCM10010343_00790 [Streptomyces avidinii]|nr:hypothetical protein GCM10010343_00790 [Streptomyces avidinii]